jgi:hypothetical protein
MRTTRAAPGTQQQVLIINSTFTASFPGAVFLTVRHYAALILADILMNF